MEPAETALDDFKGRVLAARDRLRALPAGRELEAGPQDPETGEAWDRLNVLGHMAEMLPFWVDQVRRGMRGEPYGRSEEGYRKRRAGIDLREEERKLRLKVDRGCGRVLALLDRLDERDLDRQLHVLPDRPPGDWTVGHAIEAQLVAHLEGHVEQLAQLS